MLKIPDRSRWSNLELYDSRWDTRAKKIAALVPPGSSVLELGAGTQALRSLLSGSVTYQAADLEDLGIFPTMIVDLNKWPLPVFDTCDIIIFAGVIEYIKDPDSVIDHLQKYCSSFIATYEPVGRMSPSVWWRRRRHGWFNDMKRNEFLRMFEKHGLILLKEDRWNNQHIMLFSR